MKRHEKLIAKFILKTTLHCVYIAAAINRRPVKVDVDRLSIEPREGNKFIFWRRFWVASEPLARKIVSTFAATSWADRHGWRAGWYLIGVDAAEDRLKGIAAQLSTPLTTNTDVVRRAGAVIDRYDLAIAAMTRSGEMKTLNRAYKAYRSGETNIGRRALPYEDWRDQRLEPVFDSIAAGIFCGSQQPAVKTTKNDVAPPRFNHEMTEQGT